MLKKTISYTDYNGVERTENFYFNLTEAEIAEMQLGSKGGLSEVIKQLIETENAPEIIKLFKDLVLRSYGQKSVDGKRFIKNDSLREEFSQTEAYSKLFMELAFDAEAAAKFINGIVPANMSKGEVPEDVKELMNQAGINSLPQVENNN